MHVTVSEKLYILTFFQAFIKFVTQAHLWKDLGERWTKKNNQFGKFSHVIFFICTATQIGLIAFYKLIVCGFHLELKPNLFLILVSFILVHFMYWQKLE